MQITTVQWNIGGGKTLKPGLDPTSILSYTEDGLADILSFLQSVDPDIITLQEVHKNDVLNQATYIAKQLNRAYCVSDFYADSHVEAGQKLGHAIISKYPIGNKEFQLYVNPNKQVVGEDGVTTWHSHDKGYTRCSVELGDLTLQVTTTHLVPFRRFAIAIDSEEGRKLLDDIENKLTSQAERQLIQADFNLNMPFLAEALPNLINGRLKEVGQDTPTTPKGRRYDHIVYRGLRLVGSRVDDSVLTDHFPIVTQFEA